MPERLPPKPPVIVSFEDTTPWVLPEAERTVDPQLTPRELAVLNRIAQGIGLFRLLDEHLDPLYDFGPNEPVEREVVERLLALQTIQFQGPLGPRLPMRAQLTAWGRAVVENRR